MPPMRPPRQSQGLLTKKGLSGPAARPAGSRPLRSVFSSSLEKEYIAVNSLRAKAFHRKPTPRRLMECRVHTERGKNGEINLDFQHFTGWLLGYSLLYVVCPKRTGGTGNRDRDA